jgi:hypothetical protein
MWKVLVGLLLIGVGSSRLLFGLSYFGVLRLRVPDVAGWSRMPRWLRGDDRPNAVLDCVGGSLFIAVGVVVSLA